MTVAADSSEDSFEWEPLGGFLAHGLMLRSLLPQSSVVTNDPATIDNKGSGQSCNISVSFTGDSKNGMKNDGNYFHEGWGLGFTVNFSDLNATNIAKIGEQPWNSKGHWVLQQLMSLWGVNMREGDLGPEIQSVSAFSDTIDPRSFIFTNNGGVGWIDHPGPNTYNAAHKRLVRYYSQWNFKITGYNGKKECQVAFHAEMEMRPDGSFVVHWGPGLY